MSRIIAALLVLGLSSSIVMADYIDPPGWENDPFFTHQSWEFLTSDHTGVAPDGAGPTVSPDYPTALIGECGTWTDQLGSGDGGWKFEGPIDLTPLGPLVTLYIPNVENPDRTKEIWVQASIEADFALDLENIAFRGVVTDTEWEDWEYIAPEPGEVSIEYLDPPDNKHARVTALIDITPQPEYELIYISLGVPNSEYIFIDEVDVDTRCVPEPSMPAILLGAGLLGFIAYRRRK